MSFVRRALGSMYEPAAVPLFVAIGGVLAFAGYSGVRALFHPDVSVQNHHQPAWTGVDSNQPPMHLLKPHAGKYDEVFARREAENAEHRT